jgi:hypothetical protein
VARLGVDHGAAIAADRASTTRTHLGLLLGAPSEDTSVAWRHGDGALLLAA